MENKRVRIIKKGPDKKGPVVYWMSRDQRVKDNWALFLSQKQSLKKKTPLAVIFCLVPEFLEAGLRQYDFMIQGLRQVEADLRKKNLPFFLLLGSPEKVLPPFLKKHHVSALFVDFDPLRIKTSWKNKVANKVDLPVFEVDAHNIIPTWISSDKQEYAAYTFRPKVKKLLNEFLTPIPKLKTHPFSWIENKEPPINWDNTIKSLHIDKTVPKVDWIHPGEKAAAETLHEFINHKIEKYDSQRNDPNKNAQSHLSPFLHFGQISAQRAALEIQKNVQDTDNIEAFLEELIVRRELSDNYCFYNQNYDNPKGFPNWAQKSLQEHLKDKRPDTYSRERLENSQTHDPLWNAAQDEMKKTGKMHGFMRMYWAKKILEWSQSPETAQKNAIYLNDKYELDGRDPNGYSGIAWSIGGVHDRAWFNRPIFGKIRYMSAKATEKKFDVKAYISRISQI
ncbi:MAG: deoxyribodipyrimidine photo-lyase [Candidatus Aminicenantes bacterium]|nr:deoxyribodipyrimidine photo-lyase [Candidatus Aminicenantes bacterium]